MARLASPYTESGDQRPAALTRAAITPRPPVRTRPRRRHDGESLWQLRICTPSSPAAPAVAVSGLGDQSLRRTSPPAYPATGTPYGRRHPALRLPPAGLRPARATVARCREAAHRPAIQLRRRICELRLRPGTSTSQRMAQRSHDPATARARALRAIARHAHPGYGTGTALRLWHGSYDTQLRLRHGTTPGYGAGTTPGYGTSTTPVYGTGTTPSYGTATTPSYGTSRSGYGTGTATMPRPQAAARAPCRPRVRAVRIAVRSGRLRLAEAMTVMATAMVRPPLGQPPHHAGQLGCRHRSAAGSGCCQRLAPEQQSLYARRGSVNIASRRV